MEKLYDWIGLANMIKEFAESKNLPTMTVLDSSMRGLDKIAYLKEILAPHVKIKTIGMSFDKSEQDLVDEFYLAHEDNIVKHDPITYKPTCNRIQINSRINIVIDLHRINVGLDYRTFQDRLGIQSNYAQSLSKTKPIRKLLIPTNEKLYHKLKNTLKYAINENNAYLGGAYAWKGITDSILKHYKKNHAKILDVGCNFGDSAMEMARMLNQGGIKTHVTGVDRYRTEKSRTDLGRVYECGFLRIKKHR